MPVPKPHLNHADLAYAKKRSGYIKCTSDHFIVKPCYAIKTLQLDSPNVF